MAAVSQEAEHPAIGPDDLAQAELRTRLQVFKQRQTGDTTMTTSKNQATQDAFTARFQCANRTLHHMLALLDDLPGPSEKTNWANVGDLSRVVEMLGEAEQVLEEMVNRPAKKG